MSAPKREQFNQRVRSSLVALLKHNAEQRGITPRDELERIIESAYLAPPAVAAAVASTSLATSALQPGQQVALQVHGHGVLGAVVLDPRAAAALQPAATPAEPRTPYCDEPGQDIWP